MFQIPARNPEAQPDRDQDQRPAFTSSCGRE
jgi:hypothetical protein